MKKLKLMSNFPNYKIPISPIIPPKTESTSASYDSLLVDYTAVEREFIINNLYPTLK